MTAARHDLEACRAVLVDGMHAERTDARWTQAGLVWCAARAAEGWECTRPKGHEGDHVADTSLSILGSWPAEPGDLR